MTLVSLLAVNNYPSSERFERLSSCLEGNGARVESVTWRESSAQKFDSFDGVVLSGSPEMMSERKSQSMFMKEVRAIRDSSVPILGVCFGHQMIAHAFGAEVVKDTGHVLKFVKTTVLSDDPLFQGLPRALMLLESRHEVVRSLPVGFELLATSETSMIAAMRARDRPVYGVQFHPERYSRTNPEGDTVVRNFVDLTR